MVDAPKRELVREKARAAQPVDARAMIDFIAPVAPVAAKGRKPKPTVAERLRDKVCPNCNAPVARKSKHGPAPTFCQPSCKIEHGNRLMVEGRAAIAFLKAWRIDRGSGEIAKQSFAELCAIADQFNAADAAAGRPRADYYAATILADGTKYFDRQRQKAA